MHLDNRNALKMHVENDNAFQNAFRGFILEYVVELRMDFLLGLVEVHFLNAFTTQACPGNVFRNAFPTHPEANRQGVVVRPLK